MRSNVYTIFVQFYSLTALFASPKAAVVRLKSLYTSVSDRASSREALANLRLEKGHKDYGHDIDNTEASYSMELGFSVCLDKPKDFIGKKARLQRK